MNKQKIIRGTSGSFMIVLNIVLDVSRVSEEEEDELASSYWNLMRTWKFVNWQGQLCVASKMSCVIAFSARWLMPSLRCANTESWGVEILWQLTCQYSPTRQAAWPSDHRGMPLAKLWTRRTCNPGVWGSTPNPGLLPRHNMFFPPMESSHNAVH